ncbi:MAG TPA: CoA transferase, partial [Dehalococcoidia bacterium]|nr:CoA transferase [Dehalococcoidia bacterium]
MLFEGVKVLDFSWGAALPLATKIMAHYGATVVSVESQRRPTLTRLLPPYHGGMPGLEQSAMFANFGTSKLSIALDMNHPKGQQLARRLATEWAGIVAESFGPGIMTRWGMTYDQLREVKPDLFMVSSSMFGQEGPYASYRGYGSHGASVAGFATITAWPGEVPAGPYGAYTDFISPRLTAAALLAAWDHHERTGESVYLDYSQVEGAVQFLGFAALDYQANGRVLGPARNRTAEGAPHGVYPCIGDDRWVAITVFGDEQWQRFCQAIGRPELASDPRFATHGQRKANEDALDAEVAAWTRDREAHGAAALLQAAGIAAGAVQDCRDLRNDPHLRAWGFYEQRQHPVFGDFEYDGLEFRIQDVEPTFERSPLLGEHTHMVLHDFLGLADHEIA